MKLRVNLTEVDSDLKVKFIQTKCTFATNFGEVIFVRTDDTYEGEYNVTPRVYQQTLETANKLLVDDIIVEIIPFSKVINLSNGYTVTIG